jgi:hypothetical protein
MQTVAFDRAVTESVLQRGTVFMTDTKLARTIIDQLCR